MQNTANTVALGANAIGKTQAPALGELKFAAERVANAGTQVQYFLNRFHGSTPESAAKDGPPVEQTYRNDIETLLREISRLEALVQALEVIG